MRTMSGHGMTKTSISENTNTHTHLTMSVITSSQFNQFAKEYPEMVPFYPQISSASDREFMYENFFAPADESYEEDGIEYDVDTDDYEYQQSIYA